MSLREVNKDHLGEHGGVELMALETVLPDHQDPLKFWTYHQRENTLVDLTVFAKGTFEQRDGSPGPFSGRSQLILQVAPAIQELCLGLSQGTVDNCMESLRTWWRLFDSVESAAAKTGQVMDRVEDVRQLTRVHQDFAHGNSTSQLKAMRPHLFRTFLRIVNLTLLSLRETALHWKAPERRVILRHLPPEDQIKALRIGLKREWNMVRRRWALTDRVQDEAFEPKSDEECHLLKHWRYFADAQERCGKELPTSEELRNGFSEVDFTRKTGLSLKTMRTIAFPDRWEAETAFHLCLANTGWNPSTLESLDASEPFLGNHPKDINRYLLVGTKARAGGREQPNSGLWKTTSGPGFIVKAWMERTDPLREQLKSMLATERLRYMQMAQDGALPNDLTRQLTNIHRLERGCRSVWLFVGKDGHIGWLDHRRMKQACFNGQKGSFLRVLLERINRERAACKETPIAEVTMSDFRDMFALYVWRASGGNILAVMRALNHAWLRTTEGYVDNNILNAERDGQARTFIDHLFAELGAGRLDITILAHLQRYGVVTKEMEQRLNDYRSLQRSRIDVACKDPFHPPKGIQSESVSQRICGPQRCLLCKTHAVILPESLSGVVMRIVELETIQATVPVEVWLKSRLPEELSNGLDVIKLFRSDDVQEARERWQMAIDNRSHYIPGLHAVRN